MKRLGVVSLAVLVSIEMAGATTLYKHTDRDGRVTYTDQPQVESPAKVLTVPLDLNRLDPPVLKSAPLAPH